MTRKILGGLAAALLLWPAVASATLNLRLPSDVMTSSARPARAWTVRQGPRVNQQVSSLGSGILWGQSLGTVQSPSNTQVDPSTRGPLNDVQPGAQGSGSSDPPQAAHPKPVQ